ncbi:Crp/Fnr family transcriptional regulator [Chryseobacterium sp. A321]
MAFLIDDCIENAALCEERIYRKKDLILKEGDCSDCFYYLMEGELFVFNLTQDGKEFLQHRVSEGSFFAEPAVLLQKPFPGHVEVYSQSARVLRLKRTLFLEYLQSRPDQMLFFTMSVAEKSLRKSLTMKNLVFLNPEEQIYNHLLDYKKEHFGEEASKTRVDLTRKELSLMTGLRIETVIRTVKRMERSGRLAIVKGKIFV